MDAKNNRKGFFQVCKSKVKETIGLLQRENGEIVKVDYKKLDFSPTLHLFYLRGTSPQLSLTVLLGTWKWDKLKLKISKGQVREFLANVNKLVSRAR